MFYSRPATAGKPVLAWTPATAGIPAAKGAQAAASSQAKGDGPTAARKPGGGGDWSPPRFNIRKNQTREQNRFCLCTFN